MLTVFYLRLHCVKQKKRLTSYSSGVQEWSELLWWRCDSDCTSKLTVDCTEQTKHGKGEWCLGIKDEFTHMFSVFNNTEASHMFQRKSVSARWSHLQPLQPRSKAPLLSRLRWCGTNIWPLLLYRRDKHGYLCTEEVGPYPEIGLPLNGWRNFETCFDGPFWRRHKNQTTNKRT